MTAFGDRRRDSSNSQFDGLMPPQTPEQQRAQLMAANAVPGDPSNSDFDFLEAVGIALGQCYPGAEIRASADPVQTYVRADGTPVETQRGRVTLLNRSRGLYILPSLDPEVRSFTVNPSLLIVESHNGCAEYKYSPRFSPAAFAELMEERPVSPVFWGLLKDCCEQAITDFRAQNGQPEIELEIFEFQPGKLDAPQLVHCRSGDRYEVQFSLDKTGKLICVVWDRIHVSAVTEAIPGRWPKTVVAKLLAEEFRKALPLEFLSQQGIRLGGPIEQVAPISEHPTGVTGASLLCQIGATDDKSQVLVFPDVAPLVVPDSTCFTLIEGTLDAEGKLEMIFLPLLTDSGVERLWRNAWNERGKFNATSELGVWLANYLKCRPGDFTAYPGKPAQKYYELIVRYRGNQTDFKLEYTPLPTTEEDCPELPDLPMGGAWSVPFGLSAYGRLNITAHRRPPQFG